MDNPFTSEKISNSFHLVNNTSYSEKNFLILYRLSIYIQNTKVFISYKFIFIYDKMLIPSGGGGGTVNSPRHILIPTYISITPAKPRMGNWDVSTFCDLWGIQNSYTHGFATRGRNFSVPSPPPKGIGPFNLC